MFRKFFELLTAYAISEVVNRFTYEAINKVAARWVPTAPITTAEACESKAAEQPPTEEIPALDKIGKDYETGQIFLLQLIQSAEASKIAF